MGYLTPVVCLLGLLSDVSRTASARAPNVIALLASFVLQ
jgi:hypothetical protein